MENTKTPVMVLQEYSVKNKLAPPEYTITYEKQGTHENEFEYQLTLAGMVVFGKGRSKQIAKHEAAQNALRELAEKGIYKPSDIIIKAPRVEPVSDRSPSAQINGNFIGRLLEMCLQNKLPPPDYNELQDVGPPHMKSFTYECHIGHLVTVATAGQKKVAKHTAAKEMLDKHTDEIRNLQAKLNNILNGTDMKHKRNNSGDIDVQQKRLKPNDNDHAKINCELKVTKEASPELPKEECSKSVVIEAAPSELGAIDEESHHNVEMLLTAMPELLLDTDIAPNSRALTSPDTEALNKYQEIKARIFKVSKPDLSIRIEDYPSHLKRHLEEKLVDVEDIRHLLEKSPTEDHLKELLGKIELEYEIVVMSEVRKPMVNLLINTCVKISALDWMMMHGNSG